MPSPTDPPGLAARRASLSILDAVLRSGRTVEEAAARWTARLEANDLALALAIAGETLRRLPELDTLIDARTRLPLAADAKARTVLRLALAQRLALKVPDHALVATALPLVDGGPRRLVHGVLGAILRDQPSLLDATPLPADVEQRWHAAWGEEMVLAARRAIVRRPPLDLSFADDGVAQAFATANDAMSFAPRHARLKGGAMVPDLPGFAQGGWWVQDFSASLPARLVPAVCTRVLDACAAPGGKTMQLAAAGHRVTALDRSKSRLARLSDNLARTGLAAELLVADALAYDPSSPFDAVLLDAPCSATGTFRRHPEVLYRARPAAIAEAAERQRALLDRAAFWVRPGGTLIYSTCSLEPEEGELQVERFLADHREYRVEPAPAVGGVTPSPRGWLRVLPGALEAEGGCDGFFAAHLVRAAD